jgi:two-component system OmpR family response regulator
MPIEKVLLVDDDQDLRRLAQLSLCNVGKWRVLLATGGAEALALARVEQPDVILLDVMMPGMDGPSTLMRLLAHDETRCIPVIFFTAKVQMHQINEYIKLGARGVILKPFDPMTLPFDVERLIGE